MKTRMYNVIWVRDDKGTSGQLNDTPMTHKEACTFKSKMTEYKWRRILLQEATE